MKEMILNPRGPTQMLRCTHAWTSLLKLTPKYVLSLHAKNTPKQGFFGGFFIPNLTLKQVWAQTFKSALTKISQKFWKKRPTFLAFSWKTAFSDPKTLNTFYELYWKKKPFYVFFCSCMCTPIYLSGPLGFKWNVGINVCTKIFHSI